MRDIALSIAHHEAQRGAKAFGRSEYGLSTQWVREIARHSERLFVPDPGTLPYKVEQINHSAAKLAVELHFNACGSCGATGCETLYFPGSTLGAKAALFVQSRLVKVLGNKDRGAKEGWYRMDRPGIIDWYGDEDGDETPDYFLRMTRMTSLILEPMFIEEVAPNKFDPKNIAYKIAQILEDCADEVIA